VSNTVALKTIWKEEGENLKQKKEKKQGKI
jgi:hypothetical protein